MTTLNQPAAAAPAKALLGTKLGMTQIWDENGVLRPVTVVRVDTNVVTQVRTIETDGYEAVQLAFGEIAERKVTKPLAGHFAKAGVAPVATSPRCVPRWPPSSRPARSSPLTCSRSARRLTSRAPPRVRASPVS